VPARSGWGRRRTADYPHCTLATRVPKPLLREVQAVIADGYKPIRGTVAGLATILVGGRGDIAYTDLGT
jgi:hypothetical protein